MPKITEINSSISSNTRTTTIAAKAPTTYAYNSFLSTFIPELDWTFLQDRSYGRTELNWLLCSLLHFRSVIQTRL